MKTKYAAITGSAALALILAMPALATDLTGQRQGSGRTLDKSPQVQQGYTGSQSSTSGYGTRAFDELDRNSDGYVKKDEAQGQSKLTQHWSTIDQNHDGKLDKGEFAAFEASSNVGGTKAGGMYGPGVQSGSSQGN